MSQAKCKRTKPEKPKSTLRRPPSRDEQRAEFCQFYRQNDSAIDITVALLQDGVKRFSFTRSADSPNRDISTVKRRFATEGLGFLTKVLPGLFQCLLDHLETGKSSYPGFKLTRYGYPAFMQQYFMRIFDETSSEADKAMYIDHIYQVCVAFKKLKGPYRNSVLRKQLADFVETDISLRYIDWSEPFIKGTVEHMAKDIARILKNLDPDEQIDDFRPRPGPGATNTPIEKHLRFRPHVLYTQINEQFPYEEWFYSHPWDLVTEIYKHPFRLPIEEGPTSRFTFVPKTFSKARGIAIEQLETQFLQQGVRRALYKRIESHPITAGKVNFADQSINGELALESSVTKMNATVDMSEASNRVARELVRRTWKYVPELREKLFALSSKVVEIPDEINFIKEFPVAMFAPMGSALCFPVMALTHFTLIRAICKMTGNHQYIDSIYVYGDDIICPCAIVEHVFKYMPKFGMKLNVSKSYYKSYFRESCGLHAYHGRNITPTYLKYVPNTNITAEGLISLLQVEGQLFRKGYAITSNLIRTEVNKVNKWRIKIPFVQPNSPIPGWIREEADLLKGHDVQTKRRWDPETQSFEYRVRMLSPESGALPCIQQDEGLLRWHLTGANTEETELPPFLDVFKPVRVQAGVRGSHPRFKIKDVWLRESALNRSETRKRVDRLLGVAK